MADPPANATVDHAAASPREGILPPGAKLLGFVLLLISLGMLFLASIVGYVVVRLAPKYDTITREQLTVAAIHLPGAFWVSTAILLVSSVTIHFALKSIRAGRGRALVRYLIITTVLGLAFVAVQAPSLAALLQEHFELTAARSSGAGMNVSLLGLTFMLVILHALHVFGGLVPMVIITVKATRGAYTRENHEAVRLLVIYWHFLDVVWIAMFTVMSIVA